MRARPHVRSPRAALAILVAFAGTAPARGASPAPSSAPVVVTRAGPVRGTLAEGVASFEGIPYAAPPTGDRRWRGPAPAAPWTAPLEATGFGPSCPQPEAIEPVPFGSRGGTMSEDCLTLNVWTPFPHGLPGQKLPVMLWIHGGGDLTGSSALTYYDGTSFARDGVVLVSCNYRLGVFGFFAHPALSAEARASGADTANFGLLDQVAALHWIQDNIASFGGDPASVTIFGESSGAEDVLALDASPVARGFFTRAIAESPADLGGPWRSLGDQERDDARIVAKLGVPARGATPGQLRAIDAQALLGSPYGYGDVGPIVDGRVVEGLPAAALARRPGVPLLIGTNDGEGSLLGRRANLQDALPGIPAAQGAALARAYAAIGVPPERVPRHAFTDVEFALPVRDVATRLHAAGVPAFVYRFDYVASFFRGPRADAEHGSEVPFVFETFRLAAALDADDRAVETALHGAWVAFAKTGAPGAPGLPAWPAYDPHDGRVMVIDAAPSVRDPRTGDVLDQLARFIAY